MKRSLFTGVLVLLLSAAFAVAQSTSQDKGQSQNPSPTGASNPAQPETQARPDAPPQSDAQAGATQDKNATSAAATDDDTLKRQVKEQLASNPELANVQVEVVNGKVTLTGSVPKKEDRGQAKDLVRAVPGVKSVSEHLSIAAAGTSTASSAAGSSAGANLPEPAAPSAHSEAGATTGLPQSSEQPKGESANLPSSTVSSSNSAGTAAVGAGTAAAPQGAASTLPPSGKNETAAQNSASSNLPQSSASASAPTAPATSPASAAQANSAQTGKDNVPANSTAQSSGEAANTIQNGVQGNTATQPSAQTESQAGANLPQSPDTQSTQSSTSTSATTTTSSQSGASTLPQSSEAHAGMNNDSAQLQSQIQQAFQNESTLAGANITTNVTADTIELSGTVATGKDKQTAKRIAQSFAGNRRVVDHLTVSGKGNGNKSPMNNSDQNNPKTQGDQTSNPR